MTLPSASVSNCAFSISISRCLSRIYNGRPTLGGCHRRPAEGLSPPAFSSIYRALLPGVRAGSSPALV